MAKPITTFLDNNLKLSAAGMQFLVALTALLMVIRFGMDAHRHRSAEGARFLVMLDVAAYSLLHFTLGLMQRPSLTNSYYHVWAVLLVTLRYSVKHGRPAGIALRQTPLVDLMSSFWAANILRSQIKLMLKIPVWLLWSINSARIIHGFVSSEHATASHKDNVRLVAEYMRREHRPSVATDPATMKGYRYLVLGEAKQKKEARPPHYGLELKPTHREKLITLEKIWEWERGDDGSTQGRRVSALLKDRNGMLRDLCLSFALYKLLRRRFYNLPIYESKLEKTKQLIFDGILAGRNAPSTCNTHPESLEEASESTDSASRKEAADLDRDKRVFRITKAELSFLHDFFYSRHALIFANGFPFLRLFLSTLLVGAISYMAFAIHQYSKIAKVDELGRVRHGVVFTWILLSLLGVKEIIEIAGYVFSDWTKVLLVCNYVQQPWWLRARVMEMVVRLLCRYSLVKRWHGRIGQYNLVFGLDHQRHRFASIDLPQQVQEAVLLSLRNLRNPSQQSYLDSALSAVPPAAHEKVHAKVNAVEGDVHRVLLWHIATCYCELHLAETRSIGVRRPWWVKVPRWVMIPLLWVMMPIVEYFRTRSTGVWTAPFVDQSGLEQMERKHYITAISLSQYCAHVLRLNPPLIPGNEILTKAVLDQVIVETHNALRRCYSISDTFARLQGMIQGQNNDQGKITNNQGMTQEQSGNGNKEDEASNNQGTAEGQRGKTKRDNGGAAQNTLLKMGSQLGQDLIDAADGNNEALWAFLAKHWAGYVLHLAQSTRASHHKLYLSTGGELMTHLWALLSHAGLMGAVAHGEMGTGATPIQEDQPQVLDLHPTS